MSAKTLPLLFLNLGGEMLYILDQRLRAQSIPPDKAKRVMHDIVRTMLNKRFMEEVFKPQELYSKKAVRTVFDRLAHASIMRLNAASMDKLYDLMTMAFKYQVSLCLCPTDILQVSLNHIDAMQTFVEGNTEDMSSVKYVYKLLIQTYASLGIGEFHLIRETLLNFFQDMHIRVSIFLKEKVQSSNGRFVLPTTGPVPCGSELPGTIRYFTENGSQSSTVTFKMPSKFNKISQKGSLDLQGLRNTKLGTNMYAVSSIEAVPPTKTVVQSSELETAAPNPLATAQLDLLSNLLGKSTEDESKEKFRLNLFNTEEEEQEFVATRPPEESGSEVISIDARKKNKLSEELNKIMGEMTVQGSSQDQDDDLLDLMDAAMK